MEITDMHCRSCPRRSLTLVAFLALAAIAAFRARAGADNPIFDTFNGFWSLHQELSKDGVFDPADSTDFEQQRLVTLLPGHVADISSAPASWVKRDGRYTVDASKAIRDGYAATLGDPRTKATLVCFATHLVSIDAIKGRMQEHLKYHENGVTLKRTLKGPFRGLRSP